MMGKWRGKILLPLERVSQAIEGALDRLGSTFQKSYSSVSLGRRVEIFSITSPLGFTVRVREAGLVFTSGEKRLETGFSVSPTEGSLPFLRTFLLELARHLPHPPWQRESEAREIAHKTWLKVLVVSALAVGLGSIPLFFNPPSTPLGLLIMISTLVAIAMPLAAILLTHPGADSRIQRWKWRRWIGGPEFAALGWTEKPSLK